MATLTSTPTMRPADQPQFRLPVRTLAARQALAFAAVGVAGSVIRLVTGNPAVLVADMWAAGSLAAGLAASLALLASLGPRTALGWGSTLIAAQMLRMAITIGIAAGAYTNFGLEGTKLVFWGLVVGGSLLLLAVEVATIRPALLNSSTLGATGAERQRSQESA